MIYGAKAGAKRSLIALEVALAAMVGITGSEVVYAQTPEEVVQALEKHLRHRITNPKDPNKFLVKIVPHSNPALTTRGKLTLVEMRCKPAKIKSVHLLEFHGRVIEPTIDVHKLLKEDSLKMISVKESVVDAVMSPQSFEQLFAEGKHTKDMDIKVQFTDDEKIILTGKLTILRLRNPFESVGRVQMSQDGSVSYILESLKVNGVSAPEFIKRKVEKMVNPILKREDIPFYPLIRSTRIEGGLMKVSSSDLRKQKQARHEAE